MTSADETVTVIGSGCAGWTAALYAARAKLNPFVIEGPVTSKDNPPGGQLMLTTDVENYPGFPEGITGPDLIERFEKQAKRFGARSEKTHATSVDISERPFTVWYGDDGEKSLTTETLLICTGASARKLGLESESELFGSGGVSPCAVCDGALFEGERMVVIGGGDSAMEDALYLTHYASDVLVIHRRDNLRASEVMADRALDHEDITFLWNTEVTRFLSDGDFLTGVRLIRHPEGNPKQRFEGTQADLEEMDSYDEGDFEMWDESCGAAFLAIGHIPNTSFLDGALETDEEGYILQSRHSMTNVDGVFAGGDVVDHRYRQAVTAAGMGCQTAMDAEQFLEEEGTAG